MYLSCRWLTSSVGIVEFVTLFVTPASGINSFPLPHIALNSLFLTNNLSRTIVMSAEPENPSPAELAARERDEQDRKAREAAEQAQLPYKWTQTIRDVDLTAPIPANIKGRDMEVVLTKTKIRVAIKGQEAVIEVRPGNR